MNLFSGTISTIEGSLNYSSLKQKVISQNIANVDTPGYKAKDVSFKDTLNQAMAGAQKAYRTDARHYEFKSNAAANGIVSQRNVSYNESGNSVDIDKEMSDLATNQIYYNALVDRMSGKLSSLQNVLKGGR
ncbi:flagellar basal body rod protein FlgB [Bacillus mesophilum]|uniref:Flagellar basal body rod protein FlgB n=1 Tax=Bacillus mesophilum TaxID=1071718 RepID=A0A7V7RPX8_9BACI|nr:flagellar basal body rod protein FlgB [Bacillus mesophilum]KAB2335414.1 flagellar basal body rod protein FlgB [Bacillus mesophilum]